MTEPTFRCCGCGEFLRRDEIVMENGHTVWCAGKPEDQPIQRLCGPVVEVGHD